jgi:sugar phosphate isomerase/epimerase
MKKFNIGLQLYSIREYMKDDVDNALREVKAAGYDFVEFAGYFGKSAEEIKSLLDKHNLKAISVHQTYDVFLDRPEKEIKYIKDIGAKYCAIPWLPAEKQAGTKEFPNVIKDIKKVGKMLSDNGLQLLYHNHDYEFEKYNGKTKLDILYESIEPSYLMTEFDTCWVKYAGFDPAKYILKYSGRSPVIHLKDFILTGETSGPVYALIDDKGNPMKKDKKENSFLHKPLGKGIQDFESILKAAEKAGSEFLIVEQDEPDGTEPMQAARESREYLKKLGQ